MNGNIDSIGRCRAVEITETITLPQSQTNAVDGEPLVSTRLAHLTHSKSLTAHPGWFPSPAWCGLSLLLTCRHQHLHQHLLLHRLLHLLLRYQQNIRIRHQLAERRHHLLVELALLDTNVTLEHLER